jgi:hypothetical protein
MSYRTTTYSHPFLVETSPSAKDALAKDEGLYLTTDLLLAAYLVNTGALTDAVVWGDSGRGDGSVSCFWCFYRTVVTDRSVADFTSSLASVEPRQFYRSVNQCRSAMQEASPTS